MSISRVFQSLGRGLVILGGLTLLFVAYQLWGTGVLTDRYQEDLEKDFSELVETAESSPSVDSATDSDDAEKLDYAALLWRPEGQAMAQLVIPKMGLTSTVVSGVSSESLKRGPGHFPDTPMPGMPGNTAIAGHRTTWGAPFGDIDKLEPGDEIKLQTIQGSFTYIVLEQNGGRGNFIVSPNRFDVLDQTFDSYPNRLTLVSCHPKLTARNRIIVVAELVSEPAEPFERPDYLSQPAFVFAFDEEAVAEALGEDAAKEILTNDAKENQDEGVSEEKEEEVLSKELAESEPPEIEETPTTQMGAGTATQPQQVSGFGEGLSGDRSSIVPSIAWGVALVTLIMTTGFVARRWRRWPTYFLSLAPIIAVMLVWFFNLDRALPSY
jgi:sortase A